MKVYVVSYCEWCEYEYDRSTVRKLFDSMLKAQQYVSEHSDETYEKVHTGAEFEVDEMVVE